MKGLVPSGKKLDRYEEPVELRVAAPSGRIPISACYDSVGLDVYHCWGEKTRVYLRRVKACRRLRHSAWRGACQLSSVVAE
jgi:hypothetical protein